MNIIITGAAGGIGKELTHQFLGVKSAYVYAVCRDGSALKKAKEHRRLKIIECDFQSRGGVDEMISYFNSELSSVEILIHNAAVLIKKPAAKMSWLDLENTFQVNFHAPYQISRGLFPLLKKGKGGHLVHIGSMGGVQGSQKFAGMSAYSASKGALAILTEVLATEWKGSGVSVNCVCLGSVNTKMVRKAFPGYKAALAPRSAAEYIREFSLHGSRVFNGAILPVSLGNT